MYSPSKGIVSLSHTSVSRYLPAESPSVAGENVIFSGLSSMLNSPCGAERQKRIVFLRAEMRGLEVDDARNQVPAVAVIVAAEEDLLPVVGIADRFFQCSEPWGFRIGFTEFSCDLNHGMRGEAVVQAEHRLRVVESGKEPDRVAVWHEKIAGMSCETCRAPQEIGLDIIPVSASDVDAVTVVCKVFSEERIPHDDIAAGLEIGVRRDALADLLEPPGAPFIAGGVFVFQQVMAVFKRIAPEVVFHAFECVVAEKYIQRVFDVGADFRLADVQRRGGVHAVIVIDEPLRMILVDRGVFGAESADPYCRTESRLTDFVGKCAQPSGNF